MLSAVLLSTLLAAAPLLPDGSFESADPSGAPPKSWSSLPAGASILKIGTDWNHFLRLEVQQPGNPVTVYKAVPLTPDIKALALEYRVRYSGIQPGKEAWFDGRILMNFKDAAGSLLKPAPPTPHWKGSSKGWEIKSHKFLVPDGAATLEVMFTLFNATAGTLDFDDVRLTPTDPAAIEKPVSMASPDVPPPPSSKLPPPLKVSGNSLLDPNGKKVWLQGVAIDSLEWSLTGDAVVKSTQVAIDDWKANVVRIPVKDSFWFGKPEKPSAPSQKDGGAAYRKLVDSVVNTANARGAYAVIDLHRFRAPEQPHAEFWTDVANHYKDHPGVIFELFNEPHDLTWDVWKNGGPVTDKKKSDSNAVTENSEKLTTTHCIGMQALVDAVRNTGAQNLIIAGGLDWSYDLSGILQGYALDDRHGNGIMYSTHCYPWKSGWQKAFLDAAEKYPVFIGEVGCEIEPMPFIPKNLHEDPYTWAPDILGAIQQHHLNWTAWSFHTRSSPRVLLDWDYTPTPFWGAFVKQALAGQPFQPKRLR